MNFPDIITYVKFLPEARVSIARRNLKEAGGKTPLLGALTTSGITSEMRLHNYMWAGTNRYRGGVYLQKSRNHFRLF